MLTTYIGYFREMIRHSQLFSLNDPQMVPIMPAVYLFDRFVFFLSVAMFCLMLLVCKYILNVHAIQAASELIRRAKLAAKVPESKSFLEASPFHQGKKKGGGISATIVPEV